MYDHHSLLAVIPARGGSKGLPNKNIIQCAGKPLIEWTISAAIDTIFIDEVFVSTDSIHIASISTHAGASVPLLRPQQLAQDDSSTIDVVKHAWESLVNSDGRPYDYIVLLQPTSPLRTAAHIHLAIDQYFKFKQNDTDTMVSVYKASEKYAWLMKSDESKSYIRFYYDISPSNPQRQKLGSFYLPNGAIYIMKGDAIEAGVYGNDTIPFIMDVSDSIDVDTIEDLREAENSLLLSKR